MRKIAWGILAGALLVGCAQPPYSLGPHYTEEQLVWDPAVVGDWSLEDSVAPSLSVERTGYHRYRVTLRDADDSSTYTGRVFAFAGRRAVDLTAADDSEDQELRLPVHLFLRYDVHADTLSLSYAEDSAWVARLPSRSHVMMPDGSFMLLSAPPESLQAVARAMLEDSTTRWYTEHYVRPRGVSPGVPVAHAR